MTEHWCPELLDCTKYPQDDHDELFRDQEGCENCGNGYMARESEKCPHCGQDGPRIESNEITVQCSQCHKTFREQMDKIVYLIGQRPICAECWNGGVPKNE